MKHNTKTIQCIVIAQSAQVHHVLVVDEMRRPYAVTKKIFAGDWSALKRGDVVELIVTCEPLPQTVSARLFAKRGTDAMQASGFESLVGTVLGRGIDTPYVLVECHGGNQYVVIPRVFSGDWDALVKGDSVALAVSGGDCGRVVSAWLEVPPSTPAGDY